MKQRRRGRGEGSIYQRESDGRWVATIPLESYGGKRRRKTVYGKTEKEVRTKRKVLERAIEKGQDPTVKSTTVKRWLEEWLRDHKEHDGTRETTLRSYRWLIDRHLVPTLGHLRLDKVTPGQIQAVLNEKMQGGLASATVRQMRAVLRVALADAERFGYIASNPAAKVRGPKVPQYRCRVVSPAEVKRLLDATKADRLYALWVLLAALGLRRGEALGLMWADIDLDEGVLRVQRNLQRINGVLQFCDTKSVTSKRVLAMPPGLVKTLNAHRTTQQLERLALGPAWPGTDLVFTSTKGTPLEPRTVNRLWQATRERVGLSGVRLQDLRHATASLLVAQGTHPKVVMEVLGHSQISLTMNTYAHVMPTALHGAAEVVESALFA
jgi:integrase